MNFEALSLSSQLVESLRAHNIEKPTPIQRLVIPAALDGRSLLVSSQTGSGKTLAYLLPLVQLIGARGQSNDIKALVVAPTRELAQQIAAVCTSVCGDLSCAVVVGGVDYTPQREQLALLPDIVIATPGRLIDLIEQGEQGLSDFDYFVLDEVDQLVDLGFREPISRLATLRSEVAQTLCFSATLPDEVVELVGAISPEIERLTLANEAMSVEQIEQLGYYVSFTMMDRLLIHLLRSESAEQSIVFTRSRKMADRVVGLLLENGFAAEAMHSDRSQAAREHILSRFRSGETSTLVATDVIARGIDVDSVTHVFNFGLPLNAEQYIHRCGRCGRAGRAGRAISLFTPDEKEMVNAICRLMKRHIVIDNSHPYMTPDVTQALAGVDKPKKRSRR